jgi:CubicO group peptidase (beta-lactamase class C family)
MPHERFFADSPESVGISSEKLETLLERAEREVAEGLLPSAQIAIARDGKLAAMRTFGSVTHEGTPAPATNDTLYAVFSSTKAITSAAAWLLIQDGRLSVDELVADIVPEFGVNGKDAVRVHHLFTHTAGFPHAPFRPTEFLDREKRLARFAKWKLAWTPGARFEYHPSSSMYVIAEIIERRSGATYGEFVRRRIAEPLGLEDLWCGLPRELHGRLADIVHVGEPLSEADYREMGFPVPPTTEVTEDNITLFNEPDVREAGIPGGGGTMTAADLALFYQALLSGGTGEDGRPIWESGTLSMAREVRSGDLRDPLFGKLANRALGLIIAGGKDKNYRGFGHTNSDFAFGHGGAGGQLAWADPVTGISLGYCTNAHDRNGIRQARRGVGISSRAAGCGVD